MSAVYLKLLMPKESPSWNPPSALKIIYRMTKPHHACVYKYYSMGFVILGQLWKELVTFNLNLS